MDWNGRPLAVAALAGLLCGSASPAAAQQHLPSSSETIDVSIVNVDVFVTDRKGSRVTGLSLDDFEIRENGRVQPITNFTEYRPSGAPATASPDPAAGEQTLPFAKRTIVVFVDRLSLPSFHSAPVFGAIRKTLRGSVRPGDSATVIFWDNDNSYTLQDFTDNIASLEAAVTEIEQQSTGAPGASDLMQRNLAFSRSAQFSLFRTRRKANELQAIMRSISDEDGRKIVIFATRDFGMHPRGAEMLDGPVTYGAETSTEKFREAVARTANEHGITLYPIYPAGLEWSPSFGAMSNLSGRHNDAARAAQDYKVLLNQTAALSELARETGGLMAAGSTQIAELLPRVVDDLNSFYSIAYRAPATGTTRSRDIVVRAKNPDFQVRSRREYVEKTDITRMQDRVIANLFRADQRGTIPLRVRFGAIEKTSKSRWSVPLILEVPLDALSTADGNEGSFSVFVATGGMIGVMSEIQQRAQRFSAVPVTSGASRLTYEFTLEFDDQARTVSIGVLDDQSRDYGLETADLPASRSEEHAGGE